jgi:CBS-domain-containing membrane protein
MVLIEHRPIHTRRQILERVARGSARELMETHFASARPEEELDDVLDHLLEHGVENMPVVDAGGRSLGVINLTEVLAALHSGSGPTTD